MSLSEAIENGYAAFASTPKPSKIDGCLCCSDFDLLCSLLASPLRSLSADNLSKYASAVFLTQGSESDFRYFLPRLLEICATEAGWWPSPEVLLGKLNLAHWKTWPPAQFGAVDAILKAWFESLLNSGVSDADLFRAHWDGDAVLCGLALAGAPLQPYLERLLEPAHANSLRALYWTNFSGKRRQVKLSNPFWSSNREAGAELLAFLERPDIEARVAL